MRSRTQVKKFCWVTWSCGLHLNHSDCPFHPEIIFGRCPKLIQSTRFDEAAELRIFRIFWFFTRLFRSLWGFKGYLGGFGLLRFVIFMNIFIFGFLDLDQFWALFFDFWWFKFYWLWINRYFLDFRFYFRLFFRFDIWLNRFSVILWKFFFRALNFWRL